MLREEYENKHRPVAYYSIELDSLAPEYPNCLKAIAPAAKLLEAYADLTLGNDIYLQRISLSKFFLTLN